MRNPTGSSSSSLAYDVGVKRGPWSPEEDLVLSRYVKREGEGRWRTVPKCAGLLRCGKSCRLRWMNYLRPSVKHAPIAPDEEDLILRLHRLLGNRWAIIAGRIPGRTDNEIKNYWNTHLTKKLINQGIDPRTHKPLLIINPNPNPTTSKVMILDQYHSTTDPPPRNPNNIPKLVLSGLDLHDQPQSQLQQPTTSVDVADKINSTIIHDHEDDVDQLMINTNNNNNIGGGDDAFSSFLNSLLNSDEDINISNQEYQRRMITNTTTTIMPPAYEYGNMMMMMMMSNWETGLLASTMAAATPGGSTGGVEMDPGIEY